LAAHIVFAASAKGVAVAVLGAETVGSRADGLMDSIFVGGHTLNVGRVG
jgi:hypothetical protein